MKKNIELNIFTLNFGSLKVQKKYQQALQPNIYKHFLFCIIFLAIIMIGVGTFFIIENKSIN